MIYLNAGEGISWNIGLVMIAWGSPWTEDDWPYIYHGNSNVHNMPRNWTLVTPSHSEPPKADEDGWGLLKNSEFPS